MLPRVMLACVCLFVVNCTARAYDAPPLITDRPQRAWSAAATWEGGKVPGVGARVQIQEGHAVSYDLASDQVIRSIHIAGSLTFARDRNTKLCVGLIKIQPGTDASEDGFNCDAHPPVVDPNKPRPALEVGSANAPIPAQFSSVIRLTYVEGLDKESCPAIICCAGRLYYMDAARQHLGEAVYDREAWREGCRCSRRHHRLASRRPLDCHCDLPS